MLFVKDADDDEDEEEIHSVTSFKNSRKFDSFNLT